MAKAFVEGLGWVEKQTAVVEIDEPGTYSITPDRGKVFDAVKVSVNINLDDYVKKTDFDALVARVEALEDRVNVMTFSYSGINYTYTLKAKVGMTWGEWVASDFNNKSYDGCPIWLEIDSDGYVHEVGSYAYINCFDTGSNATKDDVIIEGGYYNYSY